MLRLFFPLDEDGSPYRWSEATTEEAPLTSSASWWEIKARAEAHGHNLPGNLRASEGRLDSATAQALTEALNSIELTAAWWAGYSDAHYRNAAHREGDYLIGPWDARDIRADDRLPEFCWDHHHRLAWGSRLYADSLVIAATPSVYRALSGDPRIDTASIVSDRDRLPLSIGD